MSNVTQSQSNLAFRRHVAHLSSRLYPILSVATGLPHPSFPPTLLHYHILTEAQLDELAHFYHQRTPSALSFTYPMPVIGRWVRDGSIEDKRRRFGRFLGLRGCESPAMDKKRMEEEEAAMQRWVDARMRAGLEKEKELEAWKSKRW